MDYNRVKIILFSGDLDKVMAALTIANGAAGRDMPVEIFFTFWGLSLLRQKRELKNKTFLEKLFNLMLPMGPEKLGLSRMNWGGLGSIMMRRLIQQKDGFTPKKLLDMAMERKVKFMACEASMKILNITRQELIDYPLLHVVSVDGFLEGLDKCILKIFV